MVLGQHAEQFGGGHQPPTGAAAPIECRVFVVLVPGVAEQAGGGVLQALGHLDHLARGVVEPGSVAGQPPHLRQERDAHIGVVDPERDRQRARAGQRAVGHAHLLVRR